MSVNPYARFLAGANPLEIIAETPRRLSEIVARLGPEGVVKSPAPGKWSPREVLCHLADTELAFAFRIRQALAEPHHVIQPFDQDAWSKPYTQLDAGAALEAFAAVRKWNVTLLRTVPVEEYSKPLSHPERGEMEFRALIETMAGHDLNHLRQFGG